jgi:hypothetical protein
LVTGIGSPIANLLIPYLAGVHFSVTSIPSTTVSD